MSAVFDISRLIARAQFDTPTGIDRFELNYARWAIERFESDLQFVANGPFGHHEISRRYAQSLVTSTTNKWDSSNRDDGQSDELTALVETIERGGDSARIKTTQRNRLSAERRRRGLTNLKSMAALLWTPAAVPSSSLFIHVSHSGIHRQSDYDWLARRACLPLFYVHDLIPLLRPEFCRAGEAERHKTRIRTTLRLHRLILCNSQASARTLDEMAEADGLAQPFTAVLPPGLEDAFLHFDAASSVRTTQPYFVCLGTIEPRKNHALLLEIWRQFVERYGARAPRLVIVGRRGWDNSHVLSLLDETAAYRGTVIEIAGLSDRSVAKLLSGASALLAPSHIEGYGMPVAEAMALGTPVIASNIRAHREVSRGRAILLETLDGVGWMAAIEAHAKWPRRIDQCEQRNWTWAAHFDALHRVLVSAELAPAVQRKLHIPASNIPQRRRPAGVKTCPIA